MLATIGWLSLALGLCTVQGVIENEIQEAQIEDAVKDKITKVTDEDVKRIIIKLLDEAKAAEEAANNKE